MYMNHLNWNKLWKLNDNHRSGLGENDQELNIYWNTVYEVKYNQIKFLYIFGRWVTYISNLVFTSDFVSGI